MRKRLCVTFRSLDSHDGPQLCVVVGVQYRDVPHMLILTLMEALEVCLAVSVDVAVGVVVVQVEVVLPRLRLEAHHVPVLVRQSRHSTDLT